MAAPTILLVEDDPALRTLTARLAGERLLGPPGGDRARDVAGLVQVMAGTFRVLFDAKRTDYNKELRAQGIGNLLCGFAGALPMTGVIVRSSANVQAGAVTRASALLHGARCRWRRWRRCWSSPAGGWSASPTSGTCSAIMACCRR